MLRGVKDRSDHFCFKNLENFHGEGYFEIELEVWVSVQQEWVGKAKAQKKRRFWKTKSISGNKK